jgi:hypothetical protein
MVTVFTVEFAWAGHAGESGGALPPELTGLLGVLAVLVGALLVLTGLAAWLLFRIERRLRRWERHRSPPQ